jgi:hypothetical protein
MFSYKLIILQLFVLLSINSYSQNKVVYAKSYVKKEAVLLRWVPSDKKVFDVAIKNGYKITRYIKENNVLAAPLTLQENYKPYSSKDTLKWAFLIQNSKNGYIAYKMLGSDYKSKGPVSKEQLNNEQMFYNLLLLSCDFDPEIAKASGLYFKDTTINSSTTYVYKIEVNNMPSSLKYLPSSIEVNAAVLSTNPKITNLQAIVKNKHVKLKWNAVNFKNDFGAYNVERSLDSINYTKINKSPVILVSSQFEKKKDFVTFDDTLPTLKTKYYYRIKGVNHFGEQSNSSNTVVCIGYNELKSFPIIDSIRTLDNQKVFVKWVMKDQSENNFVKEYVLLRAKKDKGLYSKVYQSQNAGSFIDEKPEASNYYKIGAVSYGNDTTYSYSSLALIIDTIPPAIPQGLKAKVDSKGNVVLSWTKNTETDMRGYKVFKANALNEEFVQIINEFAKTPEYKDKLNLKTLSKKIFYKVVATDNNYNSSNFSEPIEVKRPDTIPPIAPIINDLKLLQNGVKISWIESNSDDAKQYALYHQNVNSKTDVILKQWLAKDSVNNFMDTLLEPGEAYRFKIIVIDDDDNVSISNYPYIKYETGYRKKINDLKAEVNRIDKYVTLTWTYANFEVDRFVIYRAKEGGQLGLIKTINGTEKLYIDKTTHIGNIYDYRIKAILKNGTESIISDALKVEY